MKRDKEGGVLRPGGVESPGGGDPEQVIMDSGSWAGLVKK